MMQLGIVASSLLGLVVNYSVVACISYSSAAFYAVVGHTKTIAVFFAGWLLFHEAMTPRKTVGIMVIFLGLFVFQHGSGARVAPAAPAPPADLENGNKSSHPHQ